jgi:hypothetical protein
MAKSAADKNKGLGALIRVAAEHGEEPMSIFTNHLSHGFGADKPARHGDKPNLARDAGRGKAVHSIEVHGSSTARQVLGAGLGGLGHATEGGGHTDASALMTPTYPGKRYARPSTVVGHRNRGRDLLAGARPGENHARGDNAIAHQNGADVLQQAYDAGSHADRMTQRKFVPD